MIEVKNISVTYDTEAVLLNVNLTIPSGVLIAIVGPNGAGKSTLIKTMIGLIKPLTGNILFDGKKYKQLKKEIAYVPQRSSVDWDFPTNVNDVVNMGRYGHVGWFKKLAKHDKEIAAQALEKLNMTYYKDRQISELSGGQQQRVFLARALAQEANTYLMDEPFQGVDIKTEKDIVNILKELKEQGKTIVVVHHDLETIPKYFDQVILINKEVVAYGNVKDVFTKENIDNTYTEIIEEDVDV